MADCVKIIKEALQAIGFTVAKKMSIFGIAVCTIIAAIFTYLVFRIDIGIDIYQAMHDAGYNIPYGEAFSGAKDLLIMANSVGTYYRNMVLMMLVSVGGALVCAILLYAEEKNKYNMKLVE